MLRSNRIILMARFCQIPPNKWLSWLSSGWIFVHCMQKERKNASRSFVQRFHYVCILFREQTLERHWRTGANIYLSMKNGCANHHSNRKYFHIQIYMNFFHHFVRKTSALYTSFGVRFCFDLPIFFSFYLISSRYSVW